MLIHTLFKALGLFRQVLLPAPFPGVGRYLQRLAIFSLFLPAFLLLQAIHWLGFGVDEVLFRGYRRVPVREPVFVLGVPRSGTTFMHRLLARHEAFTTFSTWECFLAPSITERYLWLAVAALDRLICRPGARAVGWLEMRIFGWLDDVHPMRLSAPEEDYFVFLPLLSCFILAVPFPESDWLWRIACLDRDAPAAERRRFLGWYRRCLQKHLYVHGPGKTLLSKNASFGGLAGSLVEEFPDARLIICERDAMAVVRSQLNSLQAGLRFFAVPERNARLRSRLLDCLHFYYENFDRVSAGHSPERVYRVPLWSLSHDAQAVMAELSDGLGLRPSRTLDAELRRYEANRTLRREPVYAETILEDWGLSADAIRHRFSPWRHARDSRI